MRIPLAWRVHRPKQVGVLDEYVIDRASHLLLEQRKAVNGLAAFVLLVDGLRIGENIQSRPVAKKRAVCLLKVPAGWEC